MSSNQSAFRGRVFLFATAILGAVVLHRLAERVESQTPEVPEEPLGYVSSEVLAIYAPARLIAFAEEHGPFSTNDDLARSIREAGLQADWFGVEVGDTMVDGSLQVITRIIRPGKSDLQFPEASAVLATMAGRPPHYPTFDYRTAEIRVLDERFMEQDPVRTMKDIREILLVSDPGNRGATRPIGIQAEFPAFDD